MDKPTSLFFASNERTFAKCSINYLFNRWTENFCPIFLNGLHYEKPWAPANSNIMVTTQKYKKLLAEMRKDINLKLILIQSPVTMYRWYRCIDDNLYEHQSIPCNVKEFWWRSISPCIKHTHFSTWIFP